VPVRRENDPRDVQLDVEPERRVPARSEHTPERVRVQHPSPVDRVLALAVDVLK